MLKSFCIFPRLGRTGQLAHYIKLASKSLRCIIRKCREAPTQDICLVISTGDYIRLFAVNSFTFVLRSWKNKSARSWHQRAYESLRRACKMEWERTEKCSHELPALFFWQKVTFSACILVLYTDILRNQKSEFEIYMLAGPKLPRMVSIGCFLGRKSRETSL